MFLIFFSFLTLREWNEIFEFARVIPPSSYTSLFCRVIKIPLSWHLLWHTHTHTHKHIDTNTHIHTNTHLHTHTLIQTHTVSLSLSLKSQKAVTINIHKNFWWLSKMQMKKHEERNLSLKLKKLFKRPRCTKKSLLHSITFTTRHMCRIVVEPNNRIGNLHQICKDSPWCKLCWFCDS